MAFRIFQAYLDDENIITIELEKSFEAYSIRPICESLMNEQKHSD